MTFTKKIVTVAIILIILLSGRGVFAETSQDNETTIYETTEDHEKKVKEMPVEVLEDILEEMPEGITEENKIIEETVPDNAAKVKEIIAKGYDGTVLEDRNTVLRFQAENNLLVDGIVGDMTKEALMEQSKKVYDMVPEDFKGKEWIIVINKTKKILTVYNYGEIHKKYPVALGKHTSPTPNHKFTIVNKIVDPYWGGIGGKYTPVRGGAPNNPLGRRWLGLSTDKYWGYGIHGNSDPFSIGKFISAGCIRMINEDVEELFEYIPIKTEVWIGTEEVLNEWGIKQNIEYNYQLTAKIDGKYIRQIIA